MAGHLNLASRLKTFTVLTLITALFLYVHPPTLAIIILAIAIDEYHRCVRQLPASILPVKPAAAAAADGKDGSIAASQHPVAIAAHRLPPFTTGSRTFHVVCGVAICVSSLHGHLALTAAVLTVNASILTHSLMVNAFTSRPMTTAALVMIGDLFGHVYLSFLWSHCLLFFHLPADSLVSSAASAFSSVYFSSHPLLLVLYTLVCTVVGENGALFVGRAIGRHRLAPAISPNKSIEGAVAQLLSTLAASLLFAQSLLPAQFLYHDAVLLGLLVGLSGIIGDLFESFLKRAVNVKDVGSLLPGTGGFLDRVDGLVLTFPVVYYYIRLRFGI